jgi:ABC-type proline/glycine betaine transport system permease subunit
MTATFLLCAALVVWRNGLFTLAALERMPLVLIAAVVAVGVGKTIGIEIGRRRARNLVHRLIETYAKPV